MDVASECINHALLLLSMMNPMQATMMMTKLVPWRIELLSVAALKDIRG